MRSGMKRKRYAQKVTLDMLWRTTANVERQMDTINRLLKKQAPKRRGRAAAEAGDGTPGQEGAEAEKADPTMARWTSSQNGCKVSVPEEWLGTPTGRVFGAPTVPAGKMVEEV